MSDTGQTLEQMDMRAITLMVMYNYDPKNLALVAAALEHKVDALQAGFEQVKSGGEITITVNDLETKYVSRASYDALQARAEQAEAEIAALRAVLSAVYVITIDDSYSEYSALGEINHITERYAARDAEKG